MARSKSLVSFFAALIIAPILVWVVEFNLVGLVADWKNTKVETSNAIAPPWVQDISNDVAKSLGLPTLKVLILKEDGFRAHASIERKPYTIEIGHELVNAEKPQLTKAIISHEYGHLVYKTKNLTTEHLVYFLGNIALLIGLIFCMFCYNKKIVVSLGIIASATLASVWITSYDNCPLMASTAIIFFLIFVVLTDLKEPGRKLHLFAVMLCSLSFYIIGIEVRNSYFRAEEVFSDNVGFQLVGTAPLSDMFCLMFKEHNMQAAKVFTPYRLLQEWQDIHPSVSGRAKAQGLPLNCS